MNKRHQWRWVGLALFFLLLGSTGFAGSDSVSALPSDHWFQVETVVDDGEMSLDRLLINGPPDPPAGAHRPVAELPQTDTDRGVVTIAVPAYNWCFGSAPTSAAMIAAYFDRIAYPNIYDGPTNGGIMPADNSSWPDWVDGNGDTRHQCPLSATRNGLDGRVTNGHVDDYWDYLDQVGPDPYDGNWTEHTHGECTGDYMKANKWFAGQGFNNDGAAEFYLLSNGTALNAAGMEGAGIHIYDAGYGLKLFYESRGYTVSTMYNQYIYGFDGNTQGFTWTQYMAEIDAGRPVMLHLDGHTLVGKGYDDTFAELVHFNDTWDFSTHAMVWGTSYSGMDHIGVTIVQLDVATLVELTSFAAKASADLVHLEWETASELDNAGFNLWRCDTKEGQFKKINAQLIPAQGGASWGATYTATDTRVNTGEAYFYKLEDVNFAGDSTLHGPVSVKMRPPGGMVNRAE